MVRYLELLESNPNCIARGAFERLCGYLETSDKHWISDELRTELKTVRGELVIENYIRFEAHQLVDAQFGHIRRLSDMEKVDIHKIVAQRAQHYKEVWKSVLQINDDRFMTTRKKCVAKPSVYCRPTSANSLQNSGVIGPKFTKWVSDVTTAILMSFITRAGCITAGVGRAFSRVCLSVCLFVRALKGKRLELSTPNLVHVYSIVVSRHILTQKSKGQRSKSYGYENHHCHMVASDA